MTDKPNRRTFLKRLGLGAVSAAAAGTTAAAGISAPTAGTSPAARPKPPSPGQNRPNVLFIMTDQQSRSALSASGNRHLHTPHMDSIAAAGVRFEKGYCTSPVCGPSRSSLITGRMPHETGVFVNGQAIDPSIPNLGQVFRRAGYETAWTGKWHLPASYPRDRQATPGFDYLPVPNPTGRGSQTDGPVADQAVRFLQNKHSRPFLLGVSLHNPHDICGWTGRKPVDRPEVDRCPPLPPNFAVDPDEPQFIADCRRRTYYGPENTHTKDWDHDQWRRYLYAYYRFTERVDKEIGRVLAALRDQGLEDNTLIVLTSDHGEGMAAHHWVVKLMLYENPVSVPLMFSLKGRIPAGTVDRTHLASGADLLPTICDYSGVRPPQDLTGTSLRPVIDDPKLPGRRFVVSQLQPFPKEPHRRGRMLRTARYKYVAFSEGRRPEMLFDLGTDPGETQNLARHPAHHQDLTRHRALLRQWIKQTKDHFPVPA